MLAKLFEKIVSRIFNAVRDKIPIHQFGFKEKFSTLHPLTILVSNIQTNKLKNLRTAALFLDIKRAFDGVWHRGLLYKLEKLEIPDYLIHVIKEFLQSRKLVVQINNCISQEFTAKQGVPQGSPLSPLLYNIYCHDILTDPPSPSSYLLQYTDDTALISHGKTLTKTIEKLQILTDRTQTWLNKWRLETNTTKSQLMILNHTPSDSSPTITLAHRRVRPVGGGVKYLRIHLDHTSLT